MPRQLPDWIDAYLDYTDNTEPRRSYRMWAGLSAMAAVLQRKCYLPWEAETFFPNFYIVLVGPPAARKGTAIRPALNIIKQLGISLAADEASRQKLVQNLLDASAMHTDADGLVYIHSSLTIIASELTVFIGYQNIDFLSVLCKWYDCEDRFVYDTHVHGKQEVSNVWVNLLGATTPMLIQTALPTGTFGSGFASRTIFVYEDGKGSWIPSPTLKESLTEPLRHDLGEISTMCGPFKYGKELHERYDPWYVGCQDVSFRDPRMEYYAQRRQVNLLKLCMLFSASRSSDMIITVEDFDRAAALVASTEKNMARTFEGLGSNPMAGLQLRVMKVIAEEKEISFENLMRMFYEDAHKEDLGKVLSTIEAMGFCKMDLMNGLVYYTNKEGKK